MTDEEIRRERDARIKEHTYVTIPVRLAEPTYDILWDLTARLKWCRIHEGQCEDDKELPTGYQIGDLLGSMLETKEFTDVIFQLHSMLEKLEASYGKYDD